MSEKQITLLKLVRRAILMIVDGLEDVLEMERTAELRKTAQEWKTKAFILEGELAEMKACQKTEV